MFGPVKKCLGQLKNVVGLVGIAGLVRRVGPLGPLGAVEPVGAWGLFWLVTACFDSVTHVCLAS